MVHNCSKGLFRHLQKRGNATIIWTANDSVDFDEFKNKFGPYLDGVMTDMPSVL